MTGKKSVLVERLSYPEKYWIERFSDGSWRIYRGSVFVSSIGYGVRDDAIRLAEKHNYYEKEGE